MTPLLFLGAVAAGVALLAYVAERWSVLALWGLLLVALPFI